MSTLWATGGQLLHLVLIVAAAPILAGYVAWLRGRLAGYANPSWQLPWRDLLRLLRKQPIVSENASIVFFVAPFVALAAVLSAAILVPSFTLGMVSAPLADTLALVGLLALSRCAQVFAGLDSGSAQSGLAATRLMALACLGDATLWLVVFVLSLLAGSSNLDVIAAMQQESRFGLQAAGVLALGAVVMTGLIDNESGPQPASPVFSELSGMGEALAQEFSGYSLALFDLAQAFRLLLWFDLVGTLFLPLGLSPAGIGVGWPLGVACWLAKLLVFATVLAGAGALCGRLRLAAAPSLLSIALLFAVLAAAVLLASAAST